MGRLFISNSHNKDYGHFSIGSGYPKGLIHSVCQAGRRNNIYEGEPPVKRGIGGGGGNLAMVTPPTHTHAKHTQSAGSEYSNFSEVQAHFIHVFRSMGPT